MSCGSFQVFILILDKQFAVFAFSMLYQTIVKMGKNKNNYKYRANGDYTMIQRRPLEGETKLIKAYVEGYDDVAFWRGVFDDFESPDITFEISVPLRDDLAKGKRVVLGMAEGDISPFTLFCVDSDFDYLFKDQTISAQIINTNAHIFHTYAYAAENFICYAPSLHNICVKVTKNDLRIFDFEKFFADYSRIIYPLFLWYAYSAQIDSPNIFTLIEFKGSVKLNYLEVEDNGADTLLWLKRHVDRRLKYLCDEHPKIEQKLNRFAKLLNTRGVTPENTYLFMQGHTLMDNVVMPVLESVCEKLRELSMARIYNSKRHGVALTNEQSNYNNSLHDVRTALLFNENYKDCFLYRKLRRDIEQYLKKLRAGTKE